MFDAQPIDLAYPLERLHSSCTQVAAVAEPSGGIFGVDGFQCIGDGLIKRLFGSCFGVAEELLELGPGFFDGVQVRRVRWQIEQLCAAGFNQLAYPRHFVRRQIVHHHHVARPQCGAQHLLHIGLEDIAVGGRFDGHRRKDAAQAHRAQGGQHFPATLRRGFADPLALRRPAPLPRHGRGDAAFVQENQLLRRDRGDGGEELFATLEVGLGVAFGSVEGLFLRLRPIC